MTELKIQNFDDLKKLKDWVIIDAGNVPNTPQLFLVLRHTAAEKQVRLLFVPLVKVGMNGNMTVHNPGMILKSDDVEPKEEVDDTEA